MGLGTATTTSTHTHMPHLQFSQPCYPITFGLGILFWCLESPASCGIAEPTIAALCPTASPKKTPLLTSSIIPLAPKQSPPETRHHPGQSPSSLPAQDPCFHLLIFLLHLNLVTFLPPSRGGGVRVAGAAPTLTPGCWSQLALSCQSRHFPFCLPRFLGFKVFLPH